jgi:hypothetical protein
MSGVPEGSVRVRLMSRPGWPPFAEFQLSEAHLIGRIDPADRGTQGGTVASEAAQTAWVLTQMTPEDVREAVAHGLPADYERQVEEFRRSGRPPMGVGELAEVTRDTGARSVWCCDSVGWSLIERQSAAAAARQAAADVEHSPEAER